jgi:penicillin-binding protein 1A
MSEHGSRRAAPSSSSRGGGRRSASAGGVGDKLNDLVGSVSAKFSSLRGGSGGSGGSGPDGAGGPGRGRGRAPRSSHNGAPPPKDWWMRFIDYPRYNKRGWRHWMPSIKQILAMFMAFVFTVIGLVAYAYGSTQVPDLHNDAHYIADSNPTQFTFDDGTTFAHIGLSYYPVTDINKIPKVVQNAVIAAEDKSFRDNSGVSFTGVARSALSDIFGGGGSTQGGSTITQQFVKNAFLSQDQTFNRKIKEVLISIKLSHKYGKDEILLGYLNQISFGRGAYGIDAASRLYLGKPVGQIAETDYASAAFLATLINNPSVFANALKSPDTQKTHQKTMESLKSRYNQVLANMREYNFYPRAVLDPLQGKLPQIQPQAASTDNLSGYTGYMKEAATAYLAKMKSQYPKDNATQTYANIDELAKGGYKIVTTYNKQMMDQAAQAADDGFWKAKAVSNVTGQWDPTNQKHTNDKDVHLAFASVDPNTGFVKSFYNGVDGVEDYTKYPFNAALDGGIQVGSTFKAITLATALQTGKYSLESMEPASNVRQLFWPIGSTGDNNKLQYRDRYGKAQIWPPNEDDEAPFGNGDATLKQGLAMSLNSVFADLEMEPDVRPDAVYDMAHKLGISQSTGDFNANPSLTLGVATITPMRMASAYGTFAAKGIHHEPVQVQKIIDTRTNKVVWTAPLAAGQTQAMSENTAAGVTEALTEVLKTGTAAGNPAAKSYAQSLNFNVAGKTGTTDFNHSAWFNGYTAGLSTAVAMYRQTPTGILESLKGVGYNVSDRDLSNGNYGRVNGMSYPTSVWTKFMSGQTSQNKNLVAPFAPYNPVCTGVNSIGAAAGQQPSAAGAQGGNQGQQVPGATSSCQFLATPTPTPTPTPTTVVAPPPSTPDCVRDQNLQCITTPSTPTDSGTAPQTPSTDNSSPSTTPTVNCSRHPSYPGCQTSSPSSGPSSSLPSSPTSPPTIPSTGL